MQFKGTKTYISTEDLSLAVNASVNLEKPLLIKGEPGTGKTMLAVQVAIKLFRDKTVDKIVILVVTQDGTVQEFIKDKKDYDKLLDSSLNDWYSRAK